MGAVGKRSLLFAGAPRWEEKGWRASGCGQEAWWLPLPLLDYVPCGHMAGWEDGSLELVVRPVVLDLGGAGGGAWRSLVARVLWEH